MLPQGLKIQNAEEFIAVLRCSEAAEENNSADPTRFWISHWSWDFRGNLDSPKAAASICPPYTEIYLEITSKMFLLVLLHVI